MSTWTRAFTVLARAKLNVCLHVGQVQQPNGLHEIRSLVASLELADELDFAPGTGPFTLTCEGVTVAEHENLAFLAAAALGAESVGVRLHVRKRIPVRAGLGGASADAAATLNAIARIASDRGSLWLGEAELNAAATSLGSDAPACLVPGFRSVRGTGDTVASVRLSAPPWGIALLKPEPGMPTPHAYVLLDRFVQEHGLSQSAVDERDRSTRVSAAIAANRFDDFCAAVHNDFDPVISAALPDVAQAHARLRRAGADATLLCGSGSTVAGFFPTKEVAEIAAQTIALEPGEWSHVTGFYDGA